MRIHALTERIILTRNVTEIIVRTITSYQTFPIMF